jgi:hypothetical protein
MNNRLPQISKPQPRAGLLGLGLDATDGHKRITRGPNFLLAGGSHETHSQMQETAIKVNEHLTRKGKDLAEVSVTELRDILADIHK